MYNFNLLKDEELIAIFDEVPIKQNETEKQTTIALTNKRLLFLDYIISNDGLEVLKIARGASYIKQKDVYHQINLNNIEMITNEQIILKDQSYFQYDNNELYNLLKGIK